MIGLIQRVTQAAVHVDGVEKANVRLVMSPPWTPERMSDDARDQLGIF
jgi:metal-sulfur cluster biosynthetic enzyme